MAKIKVKELQVGMTLTSDVCDPNGRFLLGTGCELNDKHLKALSAWGVISVQVNDDDIPDHKNRTAVSSEVQNAVEQQVKYRFQHNDLNLPFINELSKETVLFFVEKLGE